MIKDLSNKTATTTRRGWADKLLFNQAAKEVVSSSSIAVTNRLIRKMRLLPQVTRIRPLQLHGPTPRVPLAGGYTKALGRHQLTVEVHLQVPRSHNRTSRTFKGQPLMEVLLNYKCTLEAIMNTVLVRQCQQINLFKQSTQSSSPRCHRNPSDSRSAQRLSGIFHPVFSRSGSTFSEPLLAITDRCPSNWPEHAC